MTKGREPAGPEAPTTPPSSPPQARDAQRIDDAGRILVWLGVAVAGPLVVLALVGAGIVVATIGPRHYSCDVACRNAGIRTGLVVISFAVGYIALLLAVLKCWRIALFCGGLLGLLLSATGLIVFAVATGHDRPDAWVQLYCLAVIGGGLALAAGAALRLYARLL